MADEPIDPIDGARDQVVFGRALRVLRLLRGITQEELAARVGTDATYLSQVENGHRGLRWHTVMRFLRALDADLHQLADAMVEAKESDTQT
jgi:transcriptional regulator with XRE-family HTH domain